MPIEIKRYHKNIILTLCVLSGSCLKALVCFWHSPSIFVLKPSMPGWRTKKKMGAHCLSHVKGVPEHSDELSYHWSSLAIGQPT